MTVESFYVGDIELNRDYALWLIIKIMDFIKIGSVLWQKTVKPFEFSAALADCRQMCKKEEKQSKFGKTQTNNFLISQPNSRNLTTELPLTPFKTKFILDV